MTTDVMFWALLAAMAVLIWTVARFSAYKVRYRFTAEDLDKARKQSVEGSRLTRGGQAAEHLAPFLPGLYEEFNPKDARFIGNPIDFIIFDGLEAGELRRVVFVEVKSGVRDDLSKRQRQVRRVVHRGDVEFEVIGLAAADLVRPPASAPLGDGLR